VRLRRLIVATHRDLGYFFAGLTVLYAISGVAVNHIEHWNPNYVLRTEVLEIGTLEGRTRDDLTGEVLERMGIDQRPNSSVMMGPDELRVFFDNRTLKVAVPGGRVLDEHARRRFGFFQVNYLHLNHGKGLWTWFADLYAVALLILATTGIFIIPGRKGLGGRGRWLLVAGLAIPLLYLLVRT
jgi:hypothetical protein